MEDEFASAAGEFRVVLLSGEAGVGKSRLGRELLARHPDAAGMFARAHPPGATPAFAVRTEAVNPLLRGRSDTQVAADQEAAAQALFELDEDGFLQRLTRGRQPRAAFRGVGHQG